MCLEAGFEGEGSRPFNRGESDRVRTESSVGVLKTLLTLRRIQWGLGDWKNLTLNFNSTSLSGTVSIGQSFQVGGTEEQPGRFLCENIPVFLVFSSYVYLLVQNLRSLLTSFWARCVGYDEWGR